MTSAFASAEAPRSGRTASVIRAHGPVIFIYVLVLILLVGASIASEDFRQPSNLIEILRQSIVLGLVTIGQVFVLLGGGIDMSVGMTTRVVGLSVAVLLSATVLPPIVIIVIGLLIGMSIGYVNGTLISRIGAAPFIVTLGMMGVLQGVALAVSSGPTHAVPSFFLSAYDADLGPLPVAVLVMACVWAAAWFALSRTPFGRQVYAVGGSAKVADFAAIPVRRTVTRTYVIAGGFSAVAALFLLSRSGVGSPDMGAGLEFQSIVAAAIGGVSLYGGKGSIVGALGAVLLVAMSSNIFDILHVSAYYQDLSLGLIVLIGVAVYKTKGSAA